MATNAERPFDDAPIIFRYTRAQAIEDGVLVDLTDWVRETGFVVPVACTAAVWNCCVVPHEDTCALGQSERGRAHDLLWVLFCAVRAGSGSDRVLFKVEATADLCQQIKHQLVGVDWVFTLCNPHALRWL